MYFASNSPFEQSGAKKSEFPDAFALLAIEKWAEQNDTKVLAVSKDKGWIDFANTSKFIKVVGDLAYALTYFQPYNFAERTIKSLQDVLKKKKNNHFGSQITDSIVESLENNFEITIDASSRFYFEENDVHATYLEHHFNVDDSNRVKIKIVRVESDVLVLQLQTEVYCEVNCYFSFSMQDSVDKDYLPMGGLHAKTEENYVTSILLYLKGDFSTGLDNVELSNIEVLTTIQNAEFGDIEPDWGNDEDEPDWFDADELEAKNE